MKKYLVILFLCLFPIASWGQPSGVKSEQIITLVFSSNLYGEYEPCG